MEKCLMEEVTIPEFSYQNTSFHLFNRLFTTLLNLQSIDKFSLVRMYTCSTMIYVVS